MHAKRTNPDFLNGVPELLVLQILAREPMYGYQLVQALRDLTAGELSFGEGCIYPLLHRLETQKLLSGRREAKGGRTRIVYRLTPRGRTKLGESSESWQRIVQAVNQVLQGGKHGCCELA